MTGKSFFGRTLWPGVVGAFALAPWIGLAQDAGTPEDAIAAREAHRYRVWALAMAAPPSAGVGIDVTFYSLDLDVTGSRGVLSGTVMTEATVVASSISTVTVDLSQGLTVDSVVMNGTQLGFTRTGNTLSVMLPRACALGERLQWTVSYHGSPGSTGLGSYTDSLRDNGTRWIYTLSEPYGARDWWPCVDHPTDKADSIDIRLTVPSGYLAVANGVQRDSTAHGDGSTSVRWSHRSAIATYLVAINVAPFVTFSDWYRYGPTDSLRIINYVQPDLMARRPTARAAAALTPRMMQVFEELFGPYPFRSDGYGHVEFGWTGGMEHQTLTSLGFAAFNEGTIAHELAHQWFGDMITCRSWPDLWLNEGFATYCDAIFRERYYDRTRLVQAMKGRAPSARSAVGTLVVQDTISVNNLFSSSRVYNKGAWVLHMLRHVVGDSVFFRAVRGYADDPALRFRTASTEDFQRRVEVESGRNLDFFFDSWVREEGYPSYTYSMQVTTQESSTSATVRIVQSNGSGLATRFQMPLDLRFFGPLIDTLVTVWNDTLDQSWSFTLNGVPDSVTLDPDGWVLMTSLRVPPTYHPNGPTPDQVELSPNYPNPFNGTTWIRIGLPERGHALIEVFDISGRRVATLADGVMNPGRVDIPWTSEGPTGVYVCRLLFSSNQGIAVASRKLVHLR